jgi:hypothetical protein
MSRWAIQKELGEKDEFKRNPEIEDKIKKRNFHGSEGQ